MRLGIKPNGDKYIEFNNANDAAIWLAALGLGTNGTLPITAAQGGTGQTSLQATRNAMGLGNTSGALPVANGGTGASTAANARDNLGFAYKNNDTFSVTSSIAIAGLVSSNAKTLYVDIPLDKSTENITNFEITAMTGYFVGIGGRLFGSGSIDFTGSGYTLSCTKQGNNIVRISVAGNPVDTIVNATADTPICYFGTLTLKFTS